MRVWVVVVAVLMAFSARSESEPTRSENEQLETLATQAENAIYNDAGKLDSLINRLRKAAIAHDDSDYIMTSKLLQGVSHAIKNEYAHGLKQFLDVYEFGYAHNDTDFQINALNNMGGVYAYSNNFTKASDCYKKAMELVDSSADPFYHANLSLSLGISYNKLGEFNEALKYLKHSLSTFNEQEEMQLAQSTMNEMAYGLERQGQLRKAIDIYNSMLVLYPHNNDLRGEMVTQQRKGNALFKIGKPGQAIASLERSLFLADSAGFEFDKDTTLVALIKANAAVGQIAQAEFYANRLIDYVQDREEKRNNELMAFVESRYNLKEQERVNASLVAELQVARTDLDQIKLYLRFAAAAVVILILSMLVLYRRWVITTQKILN